jgi:ABC-2 type transport system permease protein
MSATTPAPASARTTSPGAAVRRVLAQGRFELRATLRNGEQLLVTLALPVLVLVGLVTATFVELDTGGHSRIDLLAPGVLAFSLMTSSFTSPAIATAFDRRNGVLRLLGTTPLGPSGLLAGKAFGVLTVQVLQVVVVAVTGAALGWRPTLGGLLPAVLVGLLGSVAFLALALLVAGTVRAEAVIALANVLLVVLAAGGVLLPPDNLPGALETVVTFLPSGAMGNGLRAALIDGAVPWLPLGVLAAWAAGSSAAAARWFRWSA